MQARGQRLSWFVSALLLPLLLLLLSGCILRPHSVTRVADGVPTEGRYIAPEAYAAYARGTLLEAHGERHAARAAYQSALRADDDAPEILTRLGALECELAESAEDRWARSGQFRLAQATRLDPDFSSAWFEAARCALRMRQARAALVSALKAARFDPDAPRCSLLVAEVTQRLGDLPLSRVWLDAWVTRTPDSREAWRALQSFGIRHRDSARRLRADTALAKLEPVAVSPRSLERALGSGDLKAARKAATELGLPAGELALRALAQGAPALAREQAELALGADPDDSDAWVAALVAANLERDATRFAELVRRAPTSPLAPSAAAREQLSQLLDRVQGSAWRGNAPPEPSEASRRVSEERSPTWELLPRALER